MDATAFFSYVCRRRDGMKMERQKEYRQEQQQADQADRLEDPGSGERCSHNALNMKL
jgi:hypothetical protein